MASSFSCHVIATDYKQSVLDIAKVSPSQMYHLQMNTASCPNVECRILDLLNESAYDVVSSSENINLVVAGDMIYDEVLTENMCRVWFDHYLHV